MPDIGRSDHSFLRRREFFGVATAASVAGGWVSAGFLQHDRNLNAATFEPHVGKSFRIQGSRDSLDVKLLEAKAQRFDANRPWYVRREPFTLIFHSAREVTFEDQTCRISHPRLGTVEAFASRVDQPKQGMHLQVVFG